MDSFCPLAIVCMLLQLCVPSKCYRLRWKYVAQCFWIECAAAIGKFLQSWKLMRL